MKIKRLIISLAVITLLSTVPSGTHGQESSGEDGKGEIRPLTGETVKGGNDGSIKKEPVIETGKSVKTKPVAKGKTNPVPIENGIMKDDKGAKVLENPDSNDNLNGLVLQIIDGDYRHGRIPGYETRVGKKEGPVAEEKSEIDKKTLPETIELQELKEKEAYGKKKARSDLAAKAGLVFLIILIFVLYRIRSRKAGGRILKRYPK